ncbi:MAG: hypothetical protein GOU97_03395 [Nanoarchaeota archaeon]|nr:hypothetical protein [Nanoarchaeota archaeon]
MKKLNKNKLFFLVIAFAFIVGFFCFLSVYINESASLTGHVIKLSEPKMVTKVIDGDTVIIEGGYSVRLLGIDADERGYPCYNSAKERIEELVLNKEVYLESDGEDQDMYKRYLRYLILNNENINLLLVEEGLAIARFFPENVKYLEEIIAAEKYAIKNKIGCKWGGENPSPQIQAEEPIENSVINEDAAVTPPATNVINACDAKNYVGEEKIVEGKVVDGYKSKTSTVFLNFGKPYPNQCFTAVIFSTDLINFPRDPQYYYEGKIVRVSGKIEEYEGRFEIILENSSQIMG